MAAMDLNRMIERLNALIAQNRRALHTLLFEAAAATLLEFGQNKFCTRSGITALLRP